jgi:uncharacterized protein YjbI with pentapeptide repeats
MASLADLCRSTAAIAQKLSLHILAGLTLGVNLSALATFLLLLHDRREGADINAWQLLAGYRCQQYDAGQISALQTLVSHGVSLYYFGGPEGMWLVGAKLDGAHFHHANLAGMNLTYAELQKSWLKECNCVKTDFYSADLSNSHVYGADFTGAKFDFADISGMSDDRTPGETPRRTIASPDLFKHACWKKENPPKFSDFPAPLPPWTPFEQCRKQAPEPDMPRCQAHE